MAGFYLLRSSDLSLRLLNSIPSSVRMHLTSKVPLAHIIALQPTSHSKTCTAAWSGAFKAHRNAGVRWEIFCEQLYFSGRHRKCLLSSTTRRKVISSPTAARRPCSTELDIYSSSTNSIRRKFYIPTPVLIGSFNHCG